MKRPSFEGLEHLLEVEEVKLLNDYCDLLETQNKQLEFQIRQSLIS